MKPAPHDVLEVFLQPGEYYFGGARTRIRTLLGSCVSITLWHPRLHVGGMCHYLLPGRNRAAADRPDGRYAEEVFEVFAAEMRSLGTRPEEYEAKLFGGGKMFDALEQDDIINVSQRNVRAGLELAAKHGLRIHAEDLGGDGHRNIVFDLWSGNVWVKQNRRIAAAPRRRGERNGEERRIQS